jgi:hypothetical protein
VNDPRLFVVAGERREPDLPIEAIMIRSRHTGPPLHVARLARKLVFDPSRTSVRCFALGPLEDDLEALLAHRAEGAVRIHEPQRIKARVHPLPRLQQIQGRVDAEDPHDDGERKRDAALQP